jgi:hypothetical protein
MSDSSKPQQQQSEDICVCGCHKIWHEVSGCTWGDPDSIPMYCPCKKFRPRQERKP